jgi:uncharacterized HAD superfamily protein
MRLGFDLDEVIVDLTAEFQAYLKEKYDLDWPAECFEVYNFEDCIFTEDSELNDKIRKDMLKTAHDYKLIKRAKPCEGAAEAIRLLKKDGHKIFFITSRKRKNSKATIDWIRKHHIPFDSLDVIGSRADKGFYGRRLKLDMYVDDLEENLLSMYEYKNRWHKGLLLMDKPWNQGPVDASKITRVKNWQEILRIVGISRDFDLTTRKE